MEITAKFENLGEMQEFADFMAGLNRPGQGSAQQAGTAPVQPAVSTQQATPPQSITPPTPPAQTPAVPAQQAPPAPPQPPVQQTPPQLPVQQTPAAVPTTAPTYSLDDLANAARVLMDAERQPELKALLQSFGVDSLPALSPEQYGAFATALRSMGAPI